MNHVIVTGPEHSGTGLVARIVRTGRTALHRAMPHVDDQGEYWWTGETWHPGTAYVIVHRDRVYRNRSTEERGFTPEMAAERYDWAMQRLATLRPAYWLSLEALVLNPVTQVANLSDWLGVELTIPEPIYDPDARFRRAPVLP